MMMNMLRAGTSARSILIAAVCAAALSACGSVHATSGGTAAAAHPAKVSLVIGVAARPGAKKQRRMSSEIAERMGSLFANSGEWTFK